MRKKESIFRVILMLLILSSTFLLLFFNGHPNGNQKNLEGFSGRLKTFSWSSNWSNVTVISDGYNSSYWNDGSSSSAAIAVEENGVIHVVWVDLTNGSWGVDSEIMYANYTEVTGWSNATVISDGYNGSYWNDDYSLDPSIAAAAGEIHVVWQEWTNGTWGTDREIMYASYNATRGWSNATVISDGYNGSYWNTGISENPIITVDNLGTVHVVWEDYTYGIWGVDSEIMYVNYTMAAGWSNATVISDGYNGSYWGTGPSSTPYIATDSAGVVHAVWQEWTDGVWGTDSEIMYANYTAGVGWSNGTVISDGYNGSYWNTGDSYRPSIVVESSGVIHVAWRDNTEGVWWDNLWDREIMYANYNASRGWSNATVISDGYNGSYWNNDGSRGPSVAVDAAGTVRVVWHDYTDGEWGIGPEIMHASSADGIGWSNITVISDGYNGSYWNDGASLWPAMVADNNGGVHVVWSDFTNGTWGIDTEIMYVSSKNVTSQISIPKTPFLNPISPRTDSDGIINLNWSDVTNAIIYYVYRNTSFITSVVGLTPIDTVTTSNYTGRISINGTYYYAIVAGNALGNSSISNCENVTVAISTQPAGLDSNFFIILMIIIIVGVVAVSCIATYSFRRRSQIGSDMDVPEKFKQLPLNEKIRTAIEQSITIEALDRIDAPDLMNLLRGEIGVLSPLIEERVSKLPITDDEKNEIMEELWRLPAGLQKKLLNQFEERISSSKSQIIKGS